VEIPQSKRNANSGFSRQIAMCNSKFRTFNKFFGAEKQLHCPRVFLWPKNSLKRLLGSNQVATCKEQGKAAYLLYYLL
jgi:hypothetical protein